MTNRWDALDVLRGLTIILMLMNLTPGSWEFNYPFLEHAKWEGGTLIDMVAPAFLFCIGAAMPLSLERRAAKGDTRAALMRHVITRGALLIAIGLSLNLYPHFDFATFRIPGVLQRIGLCYLLTGAFMLSTARVEGTRLLFRFRPLAVAAVVVLVSYWLLLYFVPVPGFGAPRFDPVGSWPPVLDRAVIGVQHFFPYWPVDGQVMFDPEGILSTWPSCFNVLLGALAGLTFSRGTTARPEFGFIAAGAVMMGLAVLVAGFCPLIKNLWTSTFALFSGGFALALLGVLMPVSQRPFVRPALWPARIFGENPLLAYILVFLAAPLIDAQWLGAPGATTSVRNAGQAWFSTLVEPRAASLLFALCGIGLIFVVLLVCHRKRWILKLSSARMELIDIGVNLAHDSFDADRDAILERAAQAGVAQMIVTGSSEESTRRAIELSAAHRHKLFATAGVHPHHAADVTVDALPALEELARDAHVVAVGECGLDYFRDLSPRDLQRRAFGWQLEIAAATGKPLFLHQRDAHEDFIAILREHRVTRGVAHCFTGNEMERDAYLELGLHIGITGWINDERRGLHLREVVKGIPADRLMIESDAPYLLPRDIKPAPKTRRNEPGYLPYVVRAIATARGETAEAVAAASTLTARNFFALPIR